MPGGSVAKIGPTYKKWTYIARKKTCNSRKSTWIKKAYIKENEKKKLVQYELVTVLN
jgi:hypothetical protein